MVRRGSTVRVRQRALQRLCKSRSFVLGGGNCLLARVHQWCLCPRQSRWCSRRCSGGRRHRRRFANDRAHRGRNRSRDQESTFQPARHRCLKAVAVMSDRRPQRRRDAELPGTRQPHGSVTIRRGQEGTQLLPDRQTQKAEVHAKRTLRRTASLLEQARRTAHERSRVRRAEGKAMRKRLPLDALAAFEAAADRPDPVALLESQDAVRIAEPGSDPLRADGCFAVLLLPRRRDRDGGRPGRGHRRPAGSFRPAGTRTWTTSAPSAPRGRTCLRHQRFRRDVPGTVGVGRQATRR